MRLCERHHTITRGEREIFRIIQHVLGHEIALRRKGVELPSDESCQFRIVEIASRDRTPDKQAFTRGFAQRLPAKQRQAEQDGPQ